MSVPQRLPNGNLIVRSKAGGKDNGPPGVRPMYSDKYYAAFVLDPDGHNIECDAYPGGAYSA